MVRFTKMQGCGNDYVYVYNDEEKIEDMASFTKLVSNRNFGIGSDGSEAKMCGNGIRCVAKYAYENNLVENKIMKIGTLSGIKEVEVFEENGEVKSIKVNMGIPIFNTKRLDIEYPKDVIVNERVNVLEKEIYITCLSVGNLHTVVFVDNVDNIDIKKYGTAIENMAMFKDRTNVEFVEIENRENIKVRVWERGVGETLACGTGATASVIAGYLNGVTENICKVKLKGGELEIRYNEITNELHMIGEAKKVFEGKLLDYC